MKWEVEEVGIDKAGVDEMGSRQSRNNSEYERRHEKTNVLHMRKQKRRSASR